jgi:hypothetical protein
MMARRDGSYLLQHMLTKFQVLGLNLLRSFCFNLVNDALIKRYLIFV